MIFARKFKIREIKDNIGQVCLIAGSENKIIGELSLAIVQYMLREARAEHASTCL
jgi:hypothetical protein